MTRRKIVLVLSTVFKVRGGIPRFNQMLCLALDRLSPELGLDLTVISQDDSLEDYRKHGAPWRYTTLIPGEGQLKLSQRTLAHCIRERPDAMVVGLLGMTPLAIPCMPLLRRGFSFIAHGTEAWDEPRYTRRFAARRARYAYCVSRHTGDSLVRSTGVRPAAIRLLPNTLSPEFETQTEAPIPASEAGPVELLTVSRLWAAETMKGVDHTLRAFARLCADHPALRYTIVGKGDDKPRLVELARELGVLERVDFPEDVSDDELGALYRRCALFVLPSGQEGFGIVFLEAMRFSKPCIGGNAGGTPEVIEDERTGYLVPFGESEPLVRALDRLISDAELRERMGRAGRQRLLDQFTFDAFGRRVEKYTRELLDETQEAGAVVR